MVEGGEPAAPAKASDQVMVKPEIVGATPARTEGRVMARRVRSKEFGMGNVVFMMVILANRYKSCDPGRYRYVRKKNECKK